MRRDGRSITRVWPCLVAALPAVVSLSLPAFAGPTDIGVGGWEDGTSRYALATSIDARGGSGPYLGFGFGYGGSLEWALATFNTDLGAPTVTKIAGGPSNQVTDVAVSTDGTVYAMGTAGVTVGSTSNGYETLARYSANLTTLISSVTMIATASGMGNYFPDCPDCGNTIYNVRRCGGLAIGPDGNIYVAGHRVAGQMNAINVAKYSPTLALLAQTTLTPSPYANNACKVAISTDSTVYLGGYHSYGDPSTGYADADVFLARLDSNLNFLSSATFRGTTLADVAYDIVVGADGNIFAAGAVNMVSRSVPLGQLNSDIWVGKFSPTLTFLSSAAYAGADGLADHGFSIEVGPMGELFVGGRRGSWGNSSSTEGGVILQYSKQLSLLSTTLTRKTYDLAIDPDRSGYIYAYQLGGLFINSVAADVVVGKYSNPFNAPTAAAYSNLTTSGFQANWGPNENIGGTLYACDVYTSPSYTAVVASSWTYNTFASFTGLSLNTLYYPQVKVQTQPGSVYTPLSPISTLANTPTLSGGFCTSAYSGVTNSGFTRSWCTGGNAGGPTGTDYVCEVSADSGFASIAASSTTKNISATFGGLSPNVLYYTRVRALNRDGVPTANLSLGSQRTNPNAPAAAAYTNISVSSVRANWTANGNPAGTNYAAELHGNSTFTNKLQVLQTTDLFVDISALAAGTTYYVRAKSWDGAGSAFTSLGPVVTARLLLCAGTFTFTFTDPALSAGSSPIRKVHIDELRSAINTLRQDAGLSVFNWTDPTLTAGSTLIRKVHLDEMRTALSEAYTTCGQPAPSFTDPTLTAGSTVIRATHISDLRTKVLNAP